MLGIITCILGYRVAPQTFGLVTSSNSLPEDQPHLFIFVSPWICETSANLFGKEQRFATDNLLQN